MTWTTPPDRKLFFSRQDPKDPRLGEWVYANALSRLDDLNALSKPSWLLLGYPDDEGILMNGGRGGAKEAPQMIRTSFYKMTPSALSSNSKTNFKPLVDLGDIPIELSLAERHDRGRETVKAALNAGHFVFSLGGGHDYGYADGAGFIEHCLERNLRPVVINFDAHLDVRPSDKGFHSGTPFYRLLSRYQGQFDFIEVGIQNQCNSAEHMKWAKQQGALVLALQDLEEVGLKESLEGVLEPLRARPCFLSIDIDAFSSSEAPGCSQSWTTGLHIRDFLPALRLIQSSLQLKNVGIYEVSPPLDTDHRTSKLAALLLHHILFYS